MYWKRTQEVPDPPPLQAISLNGNYLNPRESWEQSWKLCEDGASPLRHAEERVIIYCPMRDWQFCTNTEQRIKPHPVHADVMETFLSSQKRQRPKEIAGQARPWRQTGLGSFWEPPLSEFPPRMWDLELFVLCLSHQLIIHKRNVTKKF